MSQHTIKLSLLRHGRPIQGLRSLIQNWEEVADSRRTNERWQGYVPACRETIRNSLEPNSTYLGRSWVRLKPKQATCKLVSTDTAMNWRFIVQSSFNPLSDLRLKLWGIKLNIGLMLWCCIGIISNLYSHMYAVTCLWVSYSRTGGATKSDSPWGISLHVIPLVKVEAIRSLAIGHLPSLIKVHAICEMDNECLLALCR